MTLRLRNTLGGALEEFRPLEAGRARIYHCGPTVKEASHIGKFRAYVLADVLRRTLERSGLEVLQVMNITDVGHLNEFEEDLVEIAAARSGKYAWELAEEETQKFHDERRALQILDANVYPRARDHVADMIALVVELERRGLTYQTPRGVWLDSSLVSKFGELSGVTRAELERRVSQSATPSPGPTAGGERRRPLDIELWRSDVLHQMCWDSPWGRGFPGWHVECAAMSRRYLGGSFDVHTGSQDLIFPHHECEIAQVEPLTGRPLARYWIHSGAVEVDGRPMSRRNANEVTVRELLASGFRGCVLRLALLAEHYAETLEFGDAALDWGRESANLILGFREHLESCLAESGPGETGPGETGPGEEAAIVPGAWIGTTTVAFERAMENDLDFRGAVDAVTGALQSLTSEDIGDPKAALAALEDWNGVLGVF
jgi:cysteinyl-tRNA synthetase